MVKAFPMARELASQFNLRTFQFSRDWRWLGLSMLRFFFFFSFLFSLSLSYSNSMWHFHLIFLFCCGLEIYILNFWFPHDSGKEIVPNICVFLPFYAIEHDGKHCGSYNFSVNRHIDRQMWSHVRLYAQSNSTHSAILKKLNDSTCATLMMLRFCQWWIAMICWLRLYVLNAASVSFSSSHSSYIRRCTIEA